MEVTLTHPNPTFTGNITVRGTVVLSFTNGTANEDVPPSAFEAISELGILINAGAGSNPPYDANLDQSMVAVAQSTNSAFYAQQRAAYVAPLTVAQLSKPFLYQHQGTNLVIPDHTSVAYRDGFNRGLRVLDMDANSLADGVLANNHDTTADATVNGQTGNLTSFSSAQWSQFTRNVASWPGFASTLPMTTIADHVREYGRAAVYVIEPKAETSSSVQSVVDLVTSLGVQGQTVIQATTAAALAPAVSAGIAAQVITDAPNAAALLAAGISMVCMSLSAGTATIQAAVTAGLRVWVWNVNGQYDYAQAVAAGAEAVCSNDAAYTAGARGDYRYKRTTDPFGSGMWYPGHQLALNSRGTLIAGGKLQYAAGQNAWTLAGWLGPITATTYTITWTITFDAIGTSASAFQGLHICASDDQAYTDNSASTGYRNGYRIDFQQNGIFRFHRTDAAGTVLTDLAGGVSNITPANGGTATVNVQVTPTAITISVPSTGKSYTANDSTYRGGYVHLGQAGLGLGFQSSISAISVA